MSPQQVHHVKSADGQQSLTIFPADGNPIIVTGDHPHFDAILADAHEGDPDALRALADTTHVVSTYMDPLSERVSTANGRIYFDGDELDTSLTQHLLRMIGEDSDNWESLVNFLEKLYTNPSDAAREQLYDWLRARPFGITEDGDLIGYKGVNAIDYGEYDAEFASCWNGPAHINGDEYVPNQEEDNPGGVPQSVGDVVTLARSEVDPDSYVECSEGLHVGTYDFASGYGDTMLRVIVNPRDVVGVPSGVSASRKFRCCRYVIDEQITEPDTDAVVALKL
jgi:hypothetical protein